MDVKHKFMVLFADVFTCHPMFRCEVWPLVFKKWAGKGMAVKKTSKRTSRFENFGFLNLCAFFNFSWLHLESFLGWFSDKKSGSAKCNQNCKANKNLYTVELFFQIYFFEIYDPFL